MVIGLHGRISGHASRVRTCRQAPRPLARNVFDEKQAAAQLPTLRSMASADLHNLVFQRDRRIIPAILN